MVEMLKVDNAGTAQRAVTPQDGGTRLLAMTGEMNGSGFGLLKVIQ
jgi:hypothetical protein